MESNHWKYDRQGRNNLIKTEIGYGKKVAEFIVDKGHWHGPERHEVSDTGIITVYAIRTNDLVTRKIARPKQIKDLYEENGKVAPEDILQLAYEHQKKGYHKVK